MPLMTVVDILKIHENTRDVRLPRRGRRCRVGVIQGDIWVYLEQLIIHDPSLFLDEIQEALLVRVFAQHNQRDHAASRLHVEKDAAHVHST